MSEKKTLEVLFYISNVQGRPVNEILLQAVTIMSSEDRKDISPS